MDSDSFDPKKIKSLKTVDDNKEYPRKDKKKLLPTDKGDGLPLKDGTTELKFVADKKEPQDVGVVSLIVSKDELPNVKKVELLAETPEGNEPAPVKTFTPEELKEVADNLLKNRNPIKTKGIILRITKKAKRPVKLKVNIKVCVHTTTGRKRFQI